ncbi:hypothetical protein [Comamonas testosteroni]|uniref:hypothetical protein n=1 Tax=Comamonas testosteroni TaxID=285 RepID=UPI0012D2A0F4|nr:hypothetical protein [Comamonas testosteroni]
MRDCSTEQVIAVKEFIADCARHALILNTNLYENVTWLAAKALFLIAIHCRLGLAAAP